MSNLNEQLCDLNQPAALGEFSVAHCMLMPLNVTLAQRQAGCWQDMCLCLV